MEAVQRVINVLACNRRQQMPIYASDKGFDKAAASYSSDSESTLQSTEPGDFSTTDISDHSEHEFMQAGPSPELGFIAPPPGLNLPCDYAVETSAQGRGTRLNSNAAMFVPSFGGMAEAPPTTQEGCAWNSPVETQAFTPPVQKTLKKRKTISLIKGLLEDWEATVPEDPIPPQTGSEEAQAMNALQEAVSKLTPADAAMLRSLLDSKEYTQNSASHSDAALSALMQSWQLPVAGMMSMDVGHTDQAMLHNLAPMAGPLSPPPGTFCNNSTISPPPPTTSSRTWPQTRPRTPFGSKQPVMDTGKLRGANSKVAATATPEAASQQPAVDDPKETLRTNLRDLSALDHERVLMVRKINRLGLKSPAVLEAYFSKFGSVDRVMVSHSRAKSMFGRGAARVRPAGLGFLLMSSAEEVAAILAAGTDHEIEGSMVCVYPFESRPMGDDAENLDSVPETQ